MTQVGEAVLVAMLAADEKKAKCDFKPPQTKWKANLDGDADRLGGLLGKQPKKAAKEAELSSSCWPSQAHHLIPHLTLKSHPVSKWLKAGDIIYADTRYDVDHGNNGKWMPYASSLAEWKTRANKLADIKANRRLMFKVMKHAKIQLHQGKHSGSQDFGVGEMPYKECVRKYLDKINRHALSHYKKKPPCDDCKGKKQAGKYPPRDNMVRYVDKASSVLEDDIDACRIFVSRIAAECAQAGGL